jgi:hypothetical protein
LSAWAAKKVTVEFFEKPVGQKSGPWCCNNQKWGEIVFKPLARDMPGDEDSITQKHRP